MNENRQIFVNTYLTNGYNATQAYKTAYPNSKTGHQQNGSRLMLDDVIKKAITDAIKAVKVMWEDRITSVIARLQREIDGTTSVSALCLLVNAQKGYMDMLAKNEGKYGADNAQRTEEAKLTEVQVEEAKKYAKWRLVQDLTETKEPEAKNYCRKCHGELGDCSCQMGWYKADKPRQTA